MQDSRAVLPPLRGVLYKAMARKVNVPEGRFLFFAHGIVEVIKQKIEKGTKDNVENGN